MRTSPGNKLLPLPRRRRCGSTTTCLCGSDSAASATAFSAPSRALLLAAERGLFDKAISYLEVGAGNLRNTLYVQRVFRPAQIVACEKPSVVRRFESNYKEFAAAGGTLSAGIPTKKFDVIVLTYVLETICPAKQRLTLLRDIASRLKPNASLILSVRGYSGVRGKKYRKCSLSDGYVGARGAFVRGHSLGEVQALLDDCGLSFDGLQKYRSRSPENIHGIAKLRNY
jgi:hypothetical protein